MNDNTSVERWSSRFDNNPVDAVNGLFMGQVFLGTYAITPPAEALLQIIVDEQIPILDNAVSEWLKNTVVLNKFDDKRFANAVIEAFRSVVLLSLPISRDWCIDNKSLLLPWLKRHEYILENLGSSKSGKTFKDYQRLEA
jgi:hypothetical protein